MKNIFKINKTFKVALFAALGLVVMSSLYSCDFEYDLPEANSISDLTPPTAYFTYVAVIGNYKNIQFNNASASSNSYSWDFGNGKTSTDANPTNIFTAGEGTYPVKLIAKDGNGLSSEITLDVKVIDVLVPAFLNSSFEDSDRSVWGGGTVSSPYSGSGSPTPPDGTTGAKISANSTSAFLDQTILVSNNVTYKVSFYYVSKSGGTSAGHLLLEDADSHSIFVQESLPMTPDSSNYVQTSFTFKTGADTEHLRFFMTAGDVEVRFDLVEIKKF